jgi:hypothetical protein
MRIKLFIIHFFINLIVAGVSLPILLLENKKGGVPILINFSEINRDTTSFILVD